MLVLKEAPIMYEETKRYRNDCTITTLANALNITYDLSLTLLQRVQPIGDSYIITNGKIPKNKFSLSSNYRKFLRLFANEKSHKNTDYIIRGTSTLKLARELKGTHILVESRHAKVLHNGKIVDTQNTLSSEVFFSYRIYRDKYIPFLKDVCDKLGISLEEHTLKQTLNAYIKNFDMDEYEKKQQEENHALQDKKTFMKLSKEIGLTPEAYGAEIEINGQIFTIIKIEKRNRKYPVIAQSKKLNRGFKLTPCDAEYLLSLNGWHC